MSEELSRVKSRKKKVVGKQPGKSKKNSKPAVRVAKQTKPTRAVSSTLSRKGRRSSTNESTEINSKAQNNETSPTRSETYSSERVRMSKMFVNSLILIFVILLFALLWWGIEGAPPLTTLW